MRTCPHLSFYSVVRVARLEDIGRFVAEVKIRCRVCDTPFQFLGMPPGFNYEAPTVSLDGLEADLPICPQGAQPTPLQGLMGYTVKGSS